MGLTAATTLLIENPACSYLDDGGLLAFVGKLAIYGGFAGLVGSGVRGMHCLPNARSDVWNFGL